MHAAITQGPEITVALQACELSLHQVQQFWLSLSEAEQQQLLCLPTEAVLEVTRDIASDARGEICPLRALQCYCQTVLVPICVLQERSNCVPQLLAASATCVWHAVQCGAVCFLPLCIIAQHLTMPVCGLGTSAPNHTHMILSLRVLLSYVRAVHPYGLARLACPRAPAPHWETILLFQALLKEHCRIFSPPPEQSWLLLRSASPQSSERLQNTAQVLLEATRGWLGRLAGQPAF